MDAPTPIGNSTRARESALGPYAIVGATSFGIFLTALDSSVVNVSLVTMASSFGVSMQEIQWVVLAYLLILTSGMPLMGKIGDRLSKTRVFQGGMLVFILGSFFCAVSQGLVQLVAARAFQAAGASMMAANGLALVTYFTTPANRGRAMGMNQIVLAAALGLGPVVGGILTQFFGWPSIFLINLPIGVVGFLVVTKIVPQTEKVGEVRFDGIGAGLFLAFLFLSIYAISLWGYATEGLSVYDYLPYAGLAVFCLVGFIIRERGFVSPIIPLGVLGDRRMAAAMSSAILSYMALIPISFLMPFFLQEALMLSQAQTGIFLTIHPLTISVTGPIAGFLSERVEARLQTAFGLALQLVGLVSISMSMPNLLLMTASVVIMGTGLSMFTVANVNFIMTTAPKSYMGVVSALTNISRTAGFSVGTALATSIFSMNLAQLGYVAGDVGVYTTAIQLTIIAFCVLVVLAIFVSAPRGLSPAEQHSAVDDSGVMS